MFTFSHFLSKPIFPLCRSHSHTYVLMHNPLKICQGIPHIHTRTHTQFKCVPFRASHLAHFPSSQRTRSLISTLFLSLKALRFCFGGLREILRANPELARINEAAECVWIAVWEAHASGVRRSQKLVPTARNLRWTDDLTRYNPYSCLDIY